MSLSLTNSVDEVGLNWTEPSQQMKVFDKKGREMETRKKRENIEQKTTTADRGV